MDEQFIKKVINKYKSFRQNLEEQTKNNQIKLQNSDCYLIKENWDIALNRSINNFENPPRSRYTKNTSSTFTLPPQNPEFINDISSFIECINKRNKFKLISKEFIDLVNGKINLNLSQNNIVKFYAGNNKLIIEFRNENNAILINYPFSRYYTLFFIEITKNNWQNQSLYKKILSIEDLNEQIKKEEFNNIIFTKEDFIKNKNNNSINKEEVKAYKPSNDTYKGKYNRQYNRYGNNSREDNSQNTTINSSLMNNISSGSNTSSTNEVSNLNPRKWRRRENNYNSNYNKTKEDNTKKIEEPIKARYDVFSYDKYKNNRNDGNEIGKSKYERDKLRTRNNGININKNEEVDLKKQIDDLKNKIKDLEKDYKSTQNECENKDRLINKINEDNNNMKEEIRQLGNENNNLQKQNKEIKKKDDEIKRIKNINERNEKEINDLKQKNSKIQNELNEEINYNHDLAKENEALKKNEKDNLNKIKKYENQISENEKDKKNWKENERKLNDKIKLNEKNEKEYLNTIKQMEKQISEYEREKKNSKNEIENLKKSYKEIEKKLNEEIKYNDELNEQNNILRNNETKYLDEINEYKTQINNNERNNKETKNKTDALEKQINELKEDNKSYEKELKEKTNSLNEEIKNNKKKENEYLSQIKENEKNIKNLEKELNNERQDMKDIERELNDEKQNNKDLQNDLDNEKQKNKNLEKELKTEKKINDDISSKLDKEREDNQKLQNDLDNEKQKNIDLTKENKNLKKNESNYIQENDRAIKDLEEQNEELRLQNEAIQKKLDEEIENANQLLEEKEKKLQDNENKIIEYENKINEYEKKFKKLSSLISPILLYDSPTLIGLNNIGATCFMNSTLQCLSQTKDLTAYFLNEKNKEFIMKNKVKNKKVDQLCPVFLDLIEKLWDPKGPKSFSPNEFRVIVEKMNPLFKQGQAGDSKDFIIFILEQIHKELKRPLPNKINIAPQTLNQYDRVNAFNYFFNDFQNECSIISDTFFGFNETTNVCLYCKNQYNSQNQMNPVCYNYGIFNCIIFPLEEIKNMKNNNLLQYNNDYYMNNSMNMNMNNSMNMNMNNMNNSQNNCVTLYDCFMYNQKTECFTGENKNYCNMCKQLYDSLYTSHIYSSPKALILILNRGKNNVFDVKLNFSLDMDLSQFVMQRDQPTLIYSLYGVITHIGESGPNAHFVASCKSPVDNKWYRYNDAFVSSITNIQKEIIEFGNPYILFYQKN